MNTTYAILIIFSHAINNIFSFTLSRHRILSAAHAKATFTYFRRLWIIVAPLFYRRIFIEPPRVCAACLMDITSLYTLALCQHWLHLIYYGRSKRISSRQPRETLLYTTLPLYSLRHYTPDTLPSSSLRLRIFLLAHKDYYEYELGLCPESFFEEYVAPPLSRCRRLLRCRHAYAMPTLLLIFCYA